MVLRGFSHISQEVQDYVFCEAAIEIPSHKEKIIEIIITCKFIHPSIEASASQFSFRVEKKPSDVLTLQYQPLALKNTCLLPLDLMLDLEQPFLVCDEDQKPLPDGQVSSPGLLQWGLKRRDVVVPFCWELLESRSLFCSISSGLA
ncbi:hydrocephalus-inducing protein homolog [Vidua macroura]|uniref:hydrocephalus-inducing protein homolog n=1 Tax=Vidua macroura TaxID=187451 RepID=UPI0023A7ED9E|nr:hydrocephalus-inducing protein homolog [Vidua macroura]